MKYRFIVLLILLLGIALIHINGYAFPHSVVARHIIIILFIGIAGYSAYESRRKQLEEYRKCELRNIKILEAMPDNILYISGDGMIQDTKLEHDGILDFKVGHNITDKINEKHIHIVKEKIKEAITTGTLQKLELSNHNDKEVSHHEFRFVKSGTDEVLVVIRNVTSRKIYEEKLVHMSNHDALTKLYNRTFFDSELERLGKSRRYPLGVIIIDLDGLKTTNDTFGHAAGDKMIIKAANVLQDAVRADDLIARIGGDEFAILLPDTNAGGLIDAKERIYAGVEQSNSFDDGCTLKLSLGIALAETRLQLPGAVRLADKNMYKDKASRKSTNVL